MVLPPSWRSCLLLSSIVSSLFPFVGWCVCLPEGLVSLCWPPSRGSCLPRSAIVSPHVCLCWIVSPPWMDGVFALVDIASHSLPVLSFFPLSPIVSPHVCLCLMVCYARLPEVLFLHVSHCLPTCVFVLDGMAAFTRSRLPLSRVVSERVPVLDSDNVSAFERSYHIPPSSPHMCACVRWSGRLGLAFPLSPIVSLFVSACWIVCPPSGGLVSRVSQLISQFVSQLDRLPFCLPACLSSCFSLWRAVLFCIFLQTVYC